jgi:hypothetical protein
MGYGGRVLIAAVMAVVLGGLTVAGADAGGAEFGLRPVHFDPARPATESYFVYEATPGQTIHDTVRVDNAGTAAGTARLYAVDATTGETGGAAYLTAGYPRKDAGAWITLAQSQVTLPPGQSTTVPFTVTVPITAAPGQHLGGLVAEDTALQQATGGSNFQVNLRVRMVTAVQVDLPGPTVERVVVTGVGLGGAGGHQALLLGLRNDGTDMVQPQGAVTVTDTLGQVVQQLPVQLGTFLPHTAIQDPLQIQKTALAAGTYQVTVTLRYGTQGVTTSTHPLTVTPQEVTQVFSGAAPLHPPAQEATAGRGPAPPSPLALGGLTLLVAAPIGAYSLRRRACRRRVAAGPPPAPPPGDSAG